MLLFPSFSSAVVYSNFAHANMTFMHVELNLVVAILKPVFVKMNLKRYKSFLILVEGCDKSLVRNFSRYSLVYHYFYVWVIYIYLNGPPDCVYTIYRFVSE